MSEELEALDQDRIDTLIWKHVGVKSVREISEMTGLQPGDVLRRKNELLEGVDILSIQQKRQKLLIELDGMARDARDRAEGTSDEFYAGTVNASVGAVKAMLSELARMEKNDQGKIDVLNQMRVQELLRLIDTTVSNALGEIAQVHGLEKTNLMEVFQNHLVESARELSS